MRYTIKDIRQKHKMTQEELSKKSGVSRAIISGLESGERVVTSTETLSRLAKALESKVSDLFLD